MSDPTDAKVRAAGYAAAARIIPLSESAQRWRAKQNGMAVKDMPAAWRFASSDFMRARMEAEGLVADCPDVVKRLAAYWETNEIVTWLISPHPQLEGKRAIDLIRNGDVEPVLAVINRLEADGYL